MQLNRNKSTLIEEPTITEEKPRKSDTIDVELMEKISLDANYTIPGPSGGMVKQNSSLSKQVSNNDEYAYITVDGVKIPKKTISINPNKSKLWKGNPRNFSIIVDYSDLLPLIKKTKGNTQPVFARKLNVPDADGNQIEVIAGSRRRECCIELSLPLTVDLIDVNDEQAKIIADTENDGRKDTDLFTNCRYLKYTYEHLLKANPKLNIHDFAQMQAKPVSRQIMNDRLKLAEIPLWIQKLVVDVDAWTLRKGNKLKSQLKQLENSIHEIKMRLEDKTFNKPEKLIEFLSTFTAETKLVVKEYKTGNGIIKVTPMKSGSTKITIPQYSTELNDQIQALIETYSKNNPVGEGENQ